LQAFDHRGTHPLGQLVAECGNGGCRKADPAREVGDRRVDRLANGREPVDRRVCHAVIDEHLGLLLHPQVLGVDEEAVEVEDDRADTPGQVHGLRRRPIDLRRGVPWGSGVS
jgi:hypothetical protein